MVWAVELNDWWVLWEAERPGAMLLALYVSGQHELKGRPEKAGRHTPVYRDR